MKKLSLIIILIIATVSVAYANIIQGRRDASGGGPDVWYYGVGSDSYPNTTNVQSTWIWGDDVVVSSSGTITKIGVKFGGDSGVNNVKIALYNSSNTLVGCCTITGTAATGWDDCDITGVTASASSSWRVEAITSEDGITVTYAGTSGGYYDNSKSYASACYSSPQGLAEWEYGVRLYVD